MKLSAYTRLVGICIMLAVGLAGCGHGTADERLGRLLYQDHHLALTEQQVEQRITELIPLGTPEPVLASKVSALGIGRDPLSSYNLLQNSRTAVVRVELDQSTWDWVQPTWIVSFGLDDAGAVRSVKAKRFLTGP